MTPIFSSGIFIPGDMRSKFLLVFEEYLLNTYSIIPSFKNSNKSTYLNPCEIRFKLISKNIKKPIPVLWKMAKNFIRDNMHLLYKQSKCFKELEHSTEIVNLVDENMASKSQNIQLIDLTETEIEPEVIVLDETLNQLNRTFDNLDSTLCSMDADITYLGTNQISRSSTNSIKDIAKGFQIVNDVNKKMDKCLKITPSKPSVLNNENEVLVINSIVRNPKCNANSRKSTLVSNTKLVSTPNKQLQIHKKFKQTPQCNKRLDNRVAKKKKKNKVEQEELPRKKRKKLKDIGNYSLTASSSKKPLTDNVLKYYKTIEKAFKKKNKSNEKKQTNKNVQTPNSKKKHQHQEIHHVKKVKSKRFSPQNRKYKRPQESNIFNPNPVIVDKEGLRPIVIDGCNVAFRHGKGKFSARGLQICVEYFANKGHDHIKVFMPQHRQNHFTEAELSQLKAKCDIVFTPSRLINGTLRTPYDDRFIVQYAAEFEGVIVSTDNYRDLLLESPRWEDTIQKRLLMFTWVDDFLMFPVDPLGRKGPTLEQFLRF